MKNEIITYSAGISTALNNLCEISIKLSNLRKRNRLISAAQLRQLENAVAAVLIMDDMNHISHLEIQSRMHIRCSFEEYKKYAGTPFGDYLLEEIQEEAKYYRDCINDYVIMSKRSLQI